MLKVVSIDEYNYFELDINNKFAYSKEKRRTK